MEDLTNIVIVESDESVIDIVCTDCAPILYGAADGVTLEPVYTFASHEADAPQHCPNCDVLLEWDMTDDGLEYIRAAIVEHLETHIGLTDILQIWHDAYGDYIKEGTRFNNTLTQEQIDTILDVHTVTDHYMTAQLWTGQLAYLTGSEEMGGEPLEHGQLDAVVEQCEDLPDALWTEARNDCQSFIDQVEPYLAYFGDVGMTAEQFGHDFSLTRNRHGAGFWDRGYGALGSWLTTLAHAMGDASLYGEILLDPDREDADSITETLPDTLQIWSE